MSERAGESLGEAPAFASAGDSAFASLMDTLVPDESSTEAGEAGEATGAGAGGAGGSAADAGGAAGADRGAAGAGEGAGAEAGAGAAERPGGEGAAAGGAEQPADTGGRGPVPETWTVDAATLTPEFGKLSTALEENTSKAYRAAALEEVRTEHPQYFEALNKHPRLLVGTEVPALGREGMEKLTSTQDAKEWQDATKSVLVEEIQDRAGRKLEESGDFLQTVHASIELFQNNADLVPGTKGFDTELANRFATLAKPYELRVDGKLQGYSIPVQPIIDSLRSSISAERAAKPAAPAAAPAKPAKPASPPQAGIASKAGSGSNSEDFSTLFGTLGLPDLRI